MAEDARSVAKHVVDIALTLHIPDVGALGLVDKVRGTANRSEGTDRRVHATGHDQFGSLEKVGVGAVVSVRCRRHEHRCWRRPSAGHRDPQDERTVPLSRTR